MLAYHVLYLRRAKYKPIIPQSTNDTELDVRNWYGTDTKETWRVVCRQEVQLLTAKDALQWTDWGAK